MKWDCWVWTQNVLVGSQAAKLAELLERLEALERHKAPDPAR